MNPNPETRIKATVLEEDHPLSLNELCCACSVHAERIIELVEEGVLDPQGRSEDEWRFEARSLFRARAAIRLQRDLDINTPGVALALDLLEEIHSLRRRL